MMIERRLQMETEFYVQTDIVSAMTEAINIDSINQHQITSN